MPDTSSASETATVAYRMLRYMYMSCLQVNCVVVKFIIVVISRTNLYSQAAAGGVPTLCTAFNFIFCVNWKVILSM